MEVVIAFRGLGLMAQVADFERHSRRGDHQELLDWAWKYFEDRCRAGACTKCRSPHFGREGGFIPSLILQHSGFVFCFKSCAEVVGLFVVLTLLTLLVR